jgi:AcrR family transcriptional regulator
VSRQTLVRPQDRKAAILVAAADLFSQRGFAAVGVDDIGSAVGVSGPAIYRHFRSKDAILAAVVRLAAQRLDEAVAPVSVPGGIRAIEQLARGVVTVALDGPTFLAAYLRERHRVAGADHQAVRAMERRVLGAWRVALSSVRPEFDQRSLLLRQAALTGAISAAARPAGVPRPRLDDLLTQTAVALVLAPAPEPGARAPVRDWSPPAGKREEILAAALERLATRGFHGVGVDEIGEAAGISGPTVYHYYSSKGELLVDAFDRIGERVMAGADEALRTSRSAREALEQLARSYTGVAADRADLIAVTAREGFAVPDADRPRLSRRRQRLRDLWTAVVTEVRPDLSEAEARLLVRMVFPLVNAAIVSTEGEDRAPEIAAVAVATMMGS